MIIGFPFGSFCFLFFSFPSKTTPQILPFQTPHNSTYKEMHFTSVMRPPPPQKTQREKPPKSGPQGPQKKKKKKKKNF